MGFKDYVEMMNKYSRLASRQAHSQLQIQTLMQNIQAKTKQLDQINKTQENRRNRRKQLEDKEGLIQRKEKKINSRSVILANIRQFQKTRLDQNSLYKDIYNTFKENFQKESAQIKEMG